MVRKEEFFVKNWALFLFVFVNLIEFAAVRIFVCVFHPFTWTNGIEWSNSTQVS